jgi:hypothetical protein
MWPRPTEGRFVTAAIASSYLLFACMSLGSGVLVPAVEAAEAQTQQTQSATAPPGSATSASLAAAAKGEPNTSLGNSFLTAVVQEIPKLATTLIGLGLAWYVGLKITAAWDLRKKRGEFDVLLAGEFYGVVANFKAAAREWEALLKGKPAQPQPSGPNPSDDDRKRIEEHEKKLAGWEPLRVDLARRALEAETNMESILLKLVTEGLDFDGADGEKLASRQRSLSLFRLAFRNLRETIEEGTKKPPGWGHPEFWLFNRLSGEISRVIYQRSVSAPAIARPEPGPSETGERYLDLLALRTGDLHLAAARLKPSVEEFFRERRNDRRGARQDNVRRLFRPESMKIVNMLPAQRPDGDRPATDLRERPILLREQVLAVEIAEPDSDSSHLQTASEALMGANASLNSYMALLGDHIVLFTRGAGRKTFGALDDLPVTLPWLPRSPGVRAPIGADLLRWELKPRAHEILSKIAGESLA